MEAIYTEQDWCLEMQQVRAGKRLACHDCGSDHDYSPRAAERDDGTIRLYRACKWCGFWQEADGKPPYRCWLSVHVCEGGQLHPRPLTPDEVWPCARCGTLVDQTYEVPWPGRRNDK